MRSKKLLISILFLMIIMSASLSGASEKYTQAKITFETPQQMLLIKGLHLDIVWKGDHSVDIVTDADEIAELRRLGLTVDIVHDDLSAFYRSRFADKDYTGYLGLSAIESELMFIKILYPDLITDKISIGTTYEGRDIWAVKVSDNPDVDEDEPEILYTSAIHAREAITPLVLLDFITHLLENYGTDPEATYLVDNREMWFVVCVNPDGYAYNDWTNPGGGGMWRKNRMDYGTGEIGVDNNRNFGYMWGYDDEGSSPDPGDATYRGPSAFSELETQAMRDFTIAHEFVIAVYYHSYSNLLLYPWSYERGLYSPDDNIFRAIGEKIKSINGYAPGPGWILYPTNGDSDDWGYGEQTLKNKNFAMTVEVGGYDDGFWPETSRIPDLLAENLPFNLYLANAAGNIHGVMPPDAPPLTVPDSVDIGVPFDIDWADEDTLNPAVKYELYEMSDLLKITDPADNFDNWTNNGFQFHTYYYHSTGKSFWSGDPSTTERHIQTITPYTVKPGDTLKFWAYYEIQDYFDFAYVEVSTDGINFLPIDGNLSTDNDPWWHNRGHGITGVSGGASWPAEWVEGLYPLTDFEGEEIYVRFSYKDHSLYYAWYGFFVDDIYPVMNFGTMTALSSDLNDTTYAIGGKAEDYYYYKVRAMDADSQWGGFSSIERVVVGSPVEYYCGDADGNRVINFSDVVFLYDYIFAGGASPEYLEQGDADGCGSINVSDVAYLLNMFYGGGPGPCEMTGDCVLQTGNNSIEIGCPMTMSVADEDDTVLVPIYMTNDVDIAAFSLGFSFSSSDIQIVRVNQTASVAPEPLTDFIDNVNRTVILGYGDWSNQIEAQSGGLLATLEVRIPAGTPEQTIDFDSAFFAPAGEFILSPPDGGTIYPSYIDCGEAEISIIDFMCGDPDGSLTINILDVTFLINYLYKGGPPPDPEASGDANGDGSINILDVTYLINYLYKDGAPPIC